MTQFVVDDIKKGGSDAAGSPILAVYGKVKGELQGVLYGRYAVYRNETQVMVQFSDIDTEGVNQRAALAPLFPARSKVNALISSLRSSQAAYTDRKAEEYEGRLAASLLVALQGDPANGGAELDRIIRDMSEDAASDIRTRHLIYASCATAIVILIARILATSWFDHSFGPFDPDVSPNYWTATGVGAVGALFSIALEIRERRIPIDLQPWDNITDAVLRIFVGAVSATILIALLQSQIIILRVGDATLGQGPNGLVIAAFAGGFTQRLVADFLGGFSLVGNRSESAPARNAPRTVSGIANETEVTAGRASGPPAAPVPNPPPPPPDGVADPPDHEAAEEPDEDEEEAGMRTAAEGERADPVG